jgi:hypothetical protein
MWVFPKADWFNAGASNVRLSSAGAKDVEYTRSDIADKLQAEVARLRLALEFYADRNFDGYADRDFDGLWMDIGHIIEDGGDIACAALVHGETDK